MSDGHSSVAYLPDHCPTVLGPGRDGWGEYHEAALELAADVDVLIHDAQLLSHELAAEAYFGHAAANYAVELGHLAGARKVLLFHHRPERTDDELDLLGEQFADAKLEVVGRQREIWCSSCEAARCRRRRIGSERPRRGTDARPRRVVRRGLRR